MACDKSIPFLISINIGISTLKKLIVRIPGLPSDFDAELQRQGLDYPSVLWFLIFRRKLDMK